MKKVNRKLSLNKNVVTQLNNVKGGLAVTKTQGGDTCASNHPNCFTLAFPCDSYFPTCMGTCDVCSTK